MESLLEVDLDIVCQLSQQGYYDFVVIGSGVGGGIVVQRLVKEGKRVLLLEKGSLLFSSHCLNTSRPHWQRGETKGPSQDNDIVYSRVKARVATSEGSDPYIGGPVYCLGGRSTVWGLFSPKIDKETLETYFPKEVKHDLEEKFYHEALKLFSWHAATEPKYPNVPGAQDSDEETREVNFKMSLLAEALEAAPISTSTKVEVANVAAEFIPQWWYTIPQGAYSTVDYLLELLYAKNQFLTVLVNAEVLYLEKNRNHVENVIFRDSSGRARNVRARTAVVLSAGAIDSARIALNSDLRPKDRLSLVGKGLTDHEIWGVRLKTQKELKKMHSESSPAEGTNNPGSNFNDKGLSQRQKVAAASEQPLKLQCMVEVQGQPALLNVCINADTFLGRSAPILRGNGTLPAHNTLNITLQYRADLEDENQVLNLPEHDPVIKIRRKEIFSGTSPEERKNRKEWKGKMQSLVTHITDKLFEKPASVKEDKDDVPAMQLAGFGVVAHEVGTMRMTRDEHDVKGIVDKNLKFIGVDNLYVCDLSVFPVSPPANPTLTLAALALRLGDYLIGCGRCEREEMSDSSRASIALPI